MINAIKHYRTIRGLTQADIADLMGVHRATVNRWENEITPNKRKLQKIAEILRVDVEKLTFESVEFTKQDEIAILELVRKRPEMKHLLFNIADMDYEGILMLSDLVRVVKKQTGGEEPND